MKTKTFRMQLSTYKKIRRCFKAKRNETVANYMERMANEMEKNRKSDMYMSEINVEMPGSYSKRLLSRSGANA